jgi:hypothetical protein
MKKKQLYCLFQALTGTLRIKYSSNKECYNEVPLLSNPQATYKILLYWISHFHQLYVYMVIQMCENV